MTFFLYLVGFFLFCTLIGIIQSIRQKVLVYSSTANLLYCVIPSFFGGALLLFLFYLLVDSDKHSTTNAENIIFYTLLGLFVFFATFTFTNTSKYNSGFLNVFIITITKIVIAWPVVLLAQTFFYPLVEFLFTCEYCEEEYEEDELEEVQK